MTSLPRIVCSSVIRSVHQGESHGGVYLVDLGSGDVEQVLDWADPKIDWIGRGGDRGLRGIAFHGDRIFLAASDEVFVYDRSFRPLGSFRNPYLHLCHEIAIDGDRLLLASTGFDAALEYDLRRERFVGGYCVRYSRLWRARRTLDLRPRPRVRWFDPEGATGPRAGDTSHLNNVVVRGEEVLVCGTALAALWRVDGERPQKIARVPYGTHNTRPFRDGVIYNHTRSDRIVYAGPDGDVRRSVPLPAYPRDALQHADLPSDLARPAFGRGLTTLGDGVVIGGCSPATITAYDLDRQEVVARVNISMDVRNAIHGLEIWPFD